MSNTTNRSKTQGFLSHLERTLKEDIATFDQMSKNKEATSPLYKFIMSIKAVKSIALKMTQDMLAEKADIKQVNHYISPSLQLDKRADLDLSSLLFIFYNMEYDQAEFIMNRFNPNSDREVKYKRNILELYNKVIEQIRESYDFNDIRPIII